MNNINKGWIIICCLATLIAAVSANAQSNADSLFQYDTVTRTKSNTEDVSTLQKGFIEKGVKKYNVSYKNGELWFKDWGIGADIRGEDESTRRLTKSTLRIIWHADLQGHGPVIFLIFDDGILSARPIIKVDGDTTIEIASLVINDSDKVFTHHGAILVTKNGSIFATTPATFLIITSNQVASYTYKSLFGEDTPNLTHPIFCQGIDDDNVVLRDPKIKSGRTIVEIIFTLPKPEYQVVCIKDYKGAIQDYTKAIELNPNDAAAYNSRGIANYKLQKYNESIQDYKKAIALKPDDKLAYDNLGYSYLEIKDYNNAIINFNKCIELDNKSFDAFIGLALIYYVKNDLSNSKFYFNKAKELEPKIKKGMECLSELEDKGYSYSENEKEILKKIFQEFNK